MAKVLHIKGILLFVIGNLFTTFSMAQYDEDYRTFYGGLLLGGNYTQVDGDNFAGYHKAGLNAGLIVYAKSGEKTAFSMELTYAQKGSRAAGGQLPRLANDRNTVLTDYRIKLNYLEVPVLFNYFDKHKSNFGAGILYGQLVKSKETYRDQTGALYENDAKLFPFRKYDLNLVLNGNLKVWNKFFFNLRFNYSLLSIRSQYNYITGRPQQFNNTWCTRVMYMF